MRRRYRNNINNIVDGELLSYGALTGEETATYFVKTGLLDLQENDFVFFYTDGADPLIFSKEFKQNLSENGIGSIENFFVNHSKGISGSEATVVGFVVT